ncbi:DUF2142 domain-containing protein [Ectobacillus sp. sgz5001026]|uniref:DUF2142 domain-containing protein n=1 Tax=Ectobacillus sp. sgz5001026 TaxID=3242473 RepID=UPI0036D2750A
MTRSLRWSIIFISILAIIFLYASSRGDLVHEQAGNTKNLRDYIPLHAGDTVSQYLLPKHTNIEGITIGFNSEASETGFTADVKIVSDSGYDEFHISNLQLNVLGQVYLPLSKVKGNEKKLEVQLSNIKYDGAKEISLKTAEPFENASVSINDKAYQAKAMVVTYSLASVPYGKLAVLFVLAASLTAFLLFAGTNIVKEYVIIALVFGFFFAVFTPIYQASDEYVHYLKSEDVAQGHLITPKVNGYVGYYVSQKILDTEVAPIERDEKFNPDIAKYIQGSSVTPDDPSKQVFTFQPTTAVYTFIPYIPQAIGLKIAMIFHADIWTANIFGRLANLFAFLAISAYALSQIPVMKRTFMFFMLGPIIMFHASSLSGDAMLMSFSFLFFAMLMKVWFQKEEVTKKERILLAISGCLMALCKFTYWPLLLLMLLVSPEKFGSKKSYIRYNGIVIGIATLLVAGWNVFVMHYVGDAVAGGHVSASKQLAFIMQNPIGALQVFTRSFDHGMSEWLQMYNTIGFLSTPLRGIIAIYPIVLVLIAILDQQDRPFVLSNMQTWGFRFVTASVTILIMLSLYLTWTSIGNMYVYGVQGRYFIPIIPVILMLIRSHFTIKIDKPNIAIFASRAAALFLAYSFLFWYAKLY